ncbi:uncharacterized protein LOC134231782 [Saccostrea cucullata]|uniref:uncharacterized protein LOC134231782 n=1 Tax=Saccostrea cuccullata TaxID=36930 RepID=UPI002ED02CC1
MIFEIFVFIIPFYLNQRRERNAPKNIICLLWALINFVVFISVTAIARTWIFSNTGKLTTNIGIWRTSITNEETGEICYRDNVHISKNEYHWATAGFHVTSIVILFVIVMLAFINLIKDSKLILEIIFYLCILHITLSALSTAIFFTGIKEDTQTKDYHVGASFIKRCM